MNPESDSIIETRPMEPDKLLAKARAYMVERGSPLFVLFPEDMDELFGPAPLGNPKEGESDG